MKIGYSSDIKIRDHSISKVRKLKKEHVLYIPTSEIVWTRDHRALPYAIYIARRKQKDLIQQVGKNIILDDCFVPIKNAVHADSNYIYEDKYNLWWKETKNNKLPPISDPLQLADQKQQQKQPQQHQLTKTPKNKNTICLKIIRVFFVWGSNPHYTPPP